MGGCKRVSTLRIGISAVERAGASSGGDALVGLRFPRNSGHGLCGYSDLGQGYFVGDGADVADRRVAALVIVEVDIALDSLP